MSCLLSGFSYYAKATSLTPEYYQLLLDHYWRRSGTTLYRPDQLHACCVHYTLRLDSTQFKPSRDQRQTVNRFNKYVTGEAYATEAARLHPRSREQAKKRDSEFDLIERIHEAESETLQVPPEPAHNFTVTLEDDEFTEEKYLVYENYQRVVHKEDPADITRRGFRRFLCESPVQRKTIKTADGKEQKLGSFHQCYRLDGKLVAIGVLDLLPHCVSAVYFLYHESIHKHAPGKLGAIREIALAREDGYRYWYPGFYIHTCPKMRYKMDYTPQYILDPETLEWDPMDKRVMKLLDQKSYLSLSKEGKETSLDQVQIRDGVQSATKDEAAVESGDVNEDDKSTFLFDTGMPGVMTLEEVRTLIEMDHLKLRIDGSGMLFETGDLVAWHRQDVGTSGCLKAGIAELIAALGPDLLEGLVIDFWNPGF
ncbi:arginine-trna-protein transferase 1 [Colletotrichum truncatum]|uniref:Arginine-trna-protein transferase 1 n=1 Tax=Colletotrichum truncatum TaxID=5467 RepID=A0ACC3Z9K2_COLTU|nr:arginine-trna-protein transferase 1 [Colletotrichum truncatum]KAF6793637.1 arginine-trna-protein transferase 1 [Colletotrichum truncatum]